MRIHIGLENKFEGRSLAWALDLPGCYAYGADERSAVIAMGGAIPAYANWISAHTEQPWFNPPNMDIRLTETFDCYYVDADYNVYDEGVPDPSTGATLVNAWFYNDWKPLKTEEVDQALQMLSWSRTDLLAVVAGLDAARLDAQKPGEPRSIRAVLRQVGTNEWWYLDRLALADGPRTDRTEDVFELLTAQRRRLETTLPGLVGVELITGRQGEFWSPRKLIRRALWNEIDSVRTILSLLVH
jgi:hypothetical protein